MILLSFPLQGCAYQLPAASMTLLSLPPQGCAYAALKCWEDAACAFFEGSNLDPENKDVASAFQNAIAEGRKESAAKNTSQS